MNKNDEINVVIPVSRLREMFCIEEYKPMFNELFNTPSGNVTTLTAAPRIKLWLEYLGYVGKLEEYKKQTKLAKKYINSEFKEIKESVSWVMDMPEIHFLTRFSTMGFYFDLKDKTDLFKGDGFKKSFKKEKDLQKSIFKTLSYLTDELKVGKERKLKNGICDLFLEYEGGNSTAVELKKGRALIKDVFQAYSYESLGTDAVLIAKSFTDEVLELANKLGVPCYCYILEDSEVPWVMVMEKANDITSKFDEIIDITTQCDNFIVEYPFESDPKKMSKFIQKKLSAEDEYFELLKQCLKEKTGLEV